MVGLLAAGESSVAPNLGMTAGVMFPRSEQLVVASRAETAHADQAEDEDHNRNGDPMFPVEVADAARDSIDIVHDLVRHGAPGSSATDDAESTR